MKNRKTNFIKLGILLFGISIFLLNCQKEETQTLNQQNLWKVNDITKNELDNKSEIKSFLQELKTKKNVKNTSKKENDSSYNFIIDYSTIREIQVENIKSYTFKIIRENSSKSYFENLVIISSNNQIQNAYLIKYTPQKEIVYVQFHNVIVFNIKSKLLCEA